MKRFPILACFGVNIILGGCEPFPTNKVTLGECSSFVLPTDAGRSPDGYFEIYGDGSLVSGKVTSTSADPDDFPQQYGVIGPAVARLIVSRGSGTTSVDLAVPAGKKIVVIDELSNVRCTVTDAAV